MTGAGVNLRYRFESVPDELLKALQSTLDDSLSEADQRIIGRALKRSVSWRQGQLNIEVVEDEKSGATVVLNFHRQSQVAQELQEWIGQADAMISTAKHLMTKTLKVTLEDQPNE